MKATGNVDTNIKEVLRQNQNLMDLVQVLNNISIPESQTLSVYDEEYQPLSSRLLH